MRHTWQPTSGGSFYFHFLLSALKLGLAATFSRSLPPPANQRTWRSLPSRPGPQLGPALRTQPRRNSHRAQRRHINGLEAPGVSDLPLPSLRHDRRQAAPLGNGHPLAQKADNNLGRRRRVLLPPNAGIEV